MSYWATYEMPSTISSCPSAPLHKTRIKTKQCFHSWLTTEQGCLRFVVPALLNWKIHLKRLTTANSASTWTKFSKWAPLIRKKRDEFSVTWDPRLLPHPLHSTYYTYIYDRHNRQKIYSTNEENKITKITLANWSTTVKLTHAYTHTDI